MSCSLFESSKYNSLSSLSCIKTVLIYINKEPFKTKMGLDTDLASRICWWKGILNLEVICGYKQARRWKWERILNICWVLLFSVRSCNVFWPSVNWNRHVQVMYCNHLSSDHNQVQRDLQRFIFGSKYFNILQSNILFDILNFVQSWLPLGRLSMLHAEDIEIDFVKSTFSRNCVLYTWSANKI